jgi:hypothetical protein
MSKDIEKTENENLPAQDNQHNPYEAHGAQATARNIIGSILKFTKGRWKAGMENEEIPKGTRLIVEMRSLMVGYQKWENEKPVDNHMGLVSERFQAPARRAIGDMDKEQWETDEHGEPRDPWQMSNMVIMREVGTEGDTEGLYTFVTSSRGGISAIGVLSKNYGRKIREDDTLLPVVELDDDSYMHSKKMYGEIYVPVFKIVGWGTCEDVVENAADFEMVEEVGKTKETGEEVDEETGEVTETKTRTAPKKAEHAKVRQATASTKPAPAKKTPAGKKKTKF